MTNIYDPDVHSIQISGAVTKTFPHGNQLDNASVISGAAQPITDATRLWSRSTASIKGPYYPRLLKIQCLSGTPTLNSTITFCDVGGTNSTGLVFIFAADVSDKERNFAFGGIVLPKGGFGITTTADVWEILFTWSEA